MDNKKILITGGTGTFGSAFTKYIIENTKVKKIYIFSRDEKKQWEMQNKYKDNPRVGFFIGDVRDKDRIMMAMKDIDIVIHAAAQKHVISCEYNPFEAVKTNVLGTQYVVEAAIDNNVEKVIALSTDKAVNPTNLYGATKTCLEKLIIKSAAYVGSGRTKLACVRYGNVVGSRGSVLEVWKKAKKNNMPILLTDERMTRFFIRIEEAIAFVMMTLKNSEGGEIFVPKLPSLKMLDLANVIAIAGDLEIKITGIRPGEKLHETLISEDESRNTFNCGKHYVIADKCKCRRIIKGFSYTSNNNWNWITRKDLESKWYL